MRYTFLIAWSSLAVAIGVAHAAEPAITPAPELYQLPAVAMPPAPAAASGTVIGAADAPAATVSPPVIDGPCPAPGCPKVCLPKALCHPLLKCPILPSKCVEKCPAPGPRVRVVRPRPQIIEEVEEVASPSCREMFSRGLGRGSSFGVSGGAPAPVLVPQMSYSMMPVVSLQAVPTVSYGLATASSVGFGTGQSFGFAPGVGQGFGFGQGFGVAPGGGFGQGFGMGFPGAFGQSFGFGGSPFGLPGGNPLLAQALLGGQGQSALAQALGLGDSGADALRAKVQALMKERAGAQGLSGGEAGASLDDQIKDLSAKIDKAYKELRDDVNANTETIKKHTTAIGNNQEGIQALIADNARIKTDMMGKVEKAELQKQLTAEIERLETILKASADKTLTEKLKETPRPKQ